MPTAKPKPQRPTGPYVAIDYALSGATQFPSTPEKAQEGWEDFLNLKAKEGLTLVSVFPYALGANLNRRMVIFKNENL